MCAQDSRALLVTLGKMITKQKKLLLVSPVPQAKYMLYEVSWSILWPVQVDNPASGTMLMFQAFSGGVQIARCGQH
jgi:hypothetical protein